MEKQKSMIDIQMRDLIRAETTVTNELRAYASRCKTKGTPLSNNIIDTYKTSLHQIHRNRDRLYKQRSTLLNVDLQHSSIRAQASTVQGVTGMIHTSKSMIKPITEKETQKQIQDIYQMTQDNQKLDHLLDEWKQHHQDHDDEEDDGEINTIVNQVVSSKKIKKEEKTKEQNEDDTDDLNQVSEAEMNAVLREVLSLPSVPTTTTTIKSKKIIS